MKPRNWLELAKNENELLNEQLAAKGAAIAELEKELSDARDALSKEIEELKSQTNKKTNSALENFILRFLPQK